MVQHPWVHNAGFDFAELRIDKKPHLFILEIGRSQEVWHMVFHKANAAILSELLKDAVRNRRHLGVKENPEKLISVRLLVHVVDGSQIQNAVGLRVLETQELPESIALSIFCLIAGGSVEGSDGQVASWQHLKNPEV